MSVLLGNGSDSKRGGDVLGCSNCFDVHAEKKRLEKKMTHVEIDAFVCDHGFERSGLHVITAKSTFCVCLVVKTYAIQTC